MTKPTMKEWYAFGVGSSISGGLVGIVLQSPGVFAVNALCLLWNLYLYINYRGAK